MLRSVIEEFLGLLDYQTFRMACDGREALEMLRAEPCDCMLSDVRMPEMDLEELLGYVSKEFPDLTVSATSGYSDLEHAVEIMGRGAHDFLGKTAEPGRPGVDAPVDRLALADSRARR